MTRIPALERQDLDEFAPLFAMAEQIMGFVPNSMLTLGRRPDILRAFATLVATVMTGGKLDNGLKQLVAFVSSNASGCRYCQAHTTHSAERAGVQAEKIEAAFEFETNPLFTDAERAALKLARDASLVPNQTTDGHFEELRRYFADDAIIELVAVISLFGWLNRWNDTLATELEQAPRDSAENLLAAHGWTVGEHEREPSRG